MRSILRIVALSVAFGSMTACETVTVEDQAFHLPEEAAKSYLETELENYEKSARERPRDPEPHYKIAAIHFQQAKYSDAADALEHAIDVDDGDPNPRYHFHLGRVYLNLRDRARAKKHFRIALDNTRQERYSGPRAAYAYVLALEKDIDGAIENFQRCAEIDPENPEFYYFLGALSDMKKDDDRAIHYFREYLDRGGKRYRQRTVEILSHLGVTVHEAPLGIGEDLEPAPPGPEPGRESDLPAGLSDIELEPAPSVKD
jgi:tetratricopeptide (TPR) repeat protein